jgi:hypothetical protein
MQGVRRLLVIKIKLRFNVTYTALLEVYDYLNMFSY